MQTVKTIVIGDIHGRNIWKQIVDQEFDRVIFIGDYFDTHENISGVEQLHNFNEICAWARQWIDRQVIMLVGNHDFHYYPEIGYTGTSGYQPKMKVAFEDAVNKNRDLLQMCFIDEQERIYSHAGVTKEWLWYNEIENHIYDPKELVMQVNELFKTRPMVFNFFPGDYSGYGNHVRQSPIWVRPDALYRGQIKEVQIVGHTTQEKINPKKSERQGYWLVDTLGTSKEYLVIENDKITIAKCSA